MSTVRSSEQAWEIYDSYSNKRGRRPAIFKEAELFLIKAGEIKTDANGNIPKDDGGEKKKAPHVLDIILSPETVPEKQRRDIYMEAIQELTKKEQRRYSLDHLLVTKYGITKDICKIWELSDPFLRRVRTISFEYVEQKLIDEISDKYSACNPLGAMFVLKSVYGYNDRGDGGSLMVDGNIEIMAEVSDSDLVDMDYYEEEQEEKEYDNEKEV